MRSHFMIINTTAIATFLTCYSLVTQPMLQCRPNRTELKSMDYYHEFFCRFRKCKRKVPPPSLLSNDFEKSWFFSKFLVMIFFSQIKFFRPYVLECENKNQSDLKTFSLIKFSKVSLTTFACESKTYYCYYWHFWTLDGIFEIKMIKKICLGVIRFEIGGLQRKLWRFREVGLGP